MNRTHIWWPYVAAFLMGAISFVGGESRCLSMDVEVRPPLSVADAIETARFQQNRKGQALFPSPDGGRYVFFVIRGDVKNDGVWLNVYAGETSTPASAVPRLLAKHFTNGLPETSPVINNYAGPSALINPLANLPVWINNEEVAYLWADDRRHNQIFGLDVRSGKLRQLTHENLDVMAFTASSNGSLAYDVRIPVDYDTQRSAHEGFAVKSPDITMLLAGIVDGTRLYDFELCRRSVAIEVNGEYIAKEVPDSRIRCEGSELLYNPRLLSPDGRHLLINMHVQDYPDRWSAYRGNFGRSLQNAEQNPAALVREMISEFAVVDIATGMTHKLWDAPAGLNPWSFVAWSPDSKRVLIGPTLLPPEETDAAAIEGDAMAIVDASTGRYERVPLDPAIAARVEKLDWPAERRLTVRLYDGTSIELAHMDGHWSEARHGVRESSPLQIDVHQGLDQPPQLVWTDKKTGRTRMLFDPNPQLRTDFALGHVELTHWVDSAGLSWTGRLYYPAHYLSGRRYPLVIQTHGYAGKDEYSVYGQGYPEGGIPLGPGWSVYLAQPLAGRDIAVLQVGGPEKPPPQESDYPKAKSRAWALADAAKHLIDTGLVDKDKVGIMGHSATGRVVEAALAFTDFPYAAAIASDNYELNYTQSMYLGWNAVEGQPPLFGDGLDSWLDNSPALNAERIRTPMQLELTTGDSRSTTVVYLWEMFSRLRYLNKPVEYYVFPDLAHGSHMVQNPRQLMALQNRALDWWLFWLKSEEDPNPAKVGQYRDWRMLRELHIKDLSQPRTPLRTWHSAVAESK
jgi:hypothetical protein